MGDGKTKGKGSSTKTRGHCADDGRQHPGPGVSSLYAVTDGKLLSSLGLGPELVGLECNGMQCSVGCPQDSFNSLYDLIPGVQQVSPPLVGSLQTAVKGRIAL